MLERGDTSITAFEFSGGLVAVKEYSFEHITQVVSGITSVDRFARPMDVRGLYRFEYR